MALPPSKPSPGDQAQYIPPKPNGGVPSPTIVPRSPPPSPPPAPAPSKK
jgi:hypothetical protein